MKPTLIDNISTDIKTEFKIEVWKNKFYNTWKYAKPLNYSYNLFTRLKHAYYVLTGKATAFRFFEDFTEQEKSEYIKSDIKKRVVEHKKKWNEKIVSETQVVEEKIINKNVEKRAELKKRKAKIIEENKNKPQVKNKTTEKVNKKPEYPNPETTYLKYYFTNEIIAEIEKYLSAGVLREKIHVTYMPNICNWSHIEAKVVDGSSEGQETIKQEDGTLKTIKNNVMVSLKPYKTLDVKKINASKGIIITKYNGKYFRFNFIPKI